MNRRARTVLLAMAFAIGAGNTAGLQVVVVPTSQPAITADSESWYLNGEPVFFAGHRYYPAGAQIPFNQNEMVRSGFHMGIPLYTRTTIEPYSVVYVPLAGGRMQPYERPRTGELTGTAGSVPTTLPTPRATVPPPGLLPQAAGEPSQTARVIPLEIPRPAPPLPEEDATRSVGTTGRAPVRPSHTSIGGRPQGTNSIFIEYQGSRWYPVGPPKQIDISRMVRVGEYYGFEVWAAPEDSSTIYIPATRGSALAVPYTRTRPKAQVR